jgi:D-alanyl-D-alanine carboxypeptidase
MALSMPKRAGGLIKAMIVIMAAVAATLPATLVVAPAGQAAQQAGGAPRERGDHNHAALQHTLDVLTHQDGFPGALVEVRNEHGRRWTGRSGVAELGSRRPVPLGARFRIGSTTKPFVAAVVLQLVAAGRVRLDAPIERYLPGLIRGHGNDGHAITVRELLQHTSGLPDDVADLPLLGEAFLRLRFHHYPPRQLLALALRHPPVATPGRTWSYSNTNYIVLGLLIERVTGHPYGREIDRRILRPLHLDHTLVPGDSPEIPGPHAHGYLPVDQDGQTRLVDITRINPSWSWAGEEMISTTGDLNRFLAALLGGRLLPAAQLARMTQSVPAIGDWDQYPGARYGLGLEQIPLACGGAAWGHGGDIHGYSTRAWSTLDGRQVTMSLTLQRLVPTPTILRDIRTTLNTALCEDR